MSDKIPVIRLSSLEFQEFKAMQVKYRMDWPAVFSATHERNVWPCPGLGYSRHKQRVYVEGKCKTLDKIVEEYLKVRDDGGRFFISENGAFYAPEIAGVKCPDIQFVAFEIL